MHTDVNERFVWINMYDVMQYVYISCTYCNEPVKKTQRSFVSTLMIYFYFMSLIKIVVFHRTAEFLAIYVYTCILYYY